MLYKESFTPQPVAVGRWSSALLFDYDKSASNNTEAKAVLTLGRCGSSGAKPTAKHRGLHM